MVAHRPSKLTTTAPQHQQSHNDGPGPSRAGNPTRANSQRRARVPGGRSASETTTTGRAGAPARTSAPASPPSRGAQFGPDRRQFGPDRRQFGRIRGQAAASGRNGHRAQMPVTTSAREASRQQAQGSGTTPAGGLNQVRTEPGSLSEGKPTRSAGPLAARAPEAARQHLQAAPEAARQHPSSTTSNSQPQLEAQQTHNDRAPAPANSQRRARAEPSRAGTSSTSNLTTTARAGPGHGLPHQQTHNDRPRMSQAGTETGRPGRELPGPRTARAENCPGRELPGPRTGRAENRPGREPAGPRTGRAENRPGRGLG